MHAVARLHPAQASWGLTPPERSCTMNRGSNSPAGRFRSKVAALFASRSEPTSRRGGLFRRTLMVTAIGLFAGAAALGMVQQPDRTELPPSRQIQSILPLQLDQVSLSTDDSSAPYISETRQIGRAHV